MSQSEVFKLLKKENRFMTTKEISEKLNLQINTGTINANLKKMYKYNELIRKKRTIKRKVSERKYVITKIDIWRVK